MIVNYRDAKTERFAKGERVKEFSGFARQAEKRLDRLEAATSLQDLAALPGKRSRPSASLCSAPAHSRGSDRPNIQEWRWCVAHQEYEIGAASSPPVYVVINHFMTSYDHLGAAVAKCFASQSSATFCG